MRSERFINNVAKIAAIQFEMPSSNKQREMSSGFFPSFSNDRRVYFGVHTIYIQPLIQNERVREHIVLLIVQWNPIVYWIIIKKMRDEHCTAFQLRIGKLFHHHDDFAMRIIFFTSLSRNDNKSVDIDGAAREISTIVAECSCLTVFSSICCIHIILSSCERLSVSPALFIA